MLYIAYEHSYQYGTFNRFQKRNGRYETVSEVNRLQIYNGYM